MPWGWSEDGGKNSAMISSSLSKDSQDVGSNHSRGGKPNGHQPADKSISTVPHAQLAERVAELRQRLSDLQRRLPAHSAPPTMVMELEEIEDELARLQGELGESSR